MATPGLRRIVACFAVSLLVCCGNASTYNEPHQAQPYGGMPPSGSYPSSSGPYSMLGGSAFHGSADTPVNITLLLRLTGVAVSEQATWSQGLTQTVGEVARKLGMSDIAEIASANDAPAAGSQAASLLVAVTIRGCGRVMAAKNTGTLLTDMLTWGAGMLRTRVPAVSKVECVQYAQNVAYHQQRYAETSGAALQSASILGSPQYSIFSTLCSKPVYLGAYHRSMRCCASYHSEDQTEADKITSPPGYIANGGVEYYMQGGDGGDGMQNYPAGNSGSGYGSGDPCYSPCHAPDPPCVGASASGRPECANCIGCMMSFMGGDGPPAPSPPQTYEVTFTGSDGSNGYYVDVQDRMGGSMGALNSPISVNEGDVIVFKKTFQGHPLMVKDSMTGTQFFQAAIAGVGEERWTAVLGGPFEYYCTVHPQMRGTIMVAASTTMRL